jgi:S1-C subfamily serine protease
LASQKRTRKVPDQHNTQIVEGTQLKTLISQLRRGVAFIGDYKDGKLLGTGSGFVVDSKQGLVLTNEHVIEKGNRHEIIFSGLPTKRFLGNVVASGGQSYNDYPRKDWALLKLMKYQPEEILALPLPDPSSKEFGHDELVLDRVITLGYPGTPFGGGNFVSNQDDFRPSLGRVNRVHRLIDIEKESNELIEVTTGIIEKGNSGGPLFDLDKGVIIGINTMAANRPWLIHVQNFAISILPVMQEINSSLSDVENEKTLDTNSLERKTDSYLGVQRYEDANRSASRLPPQNITKMLARALLEMQHDNYHEAANLFDSILNSESRNDMAAGFHARYKMAAEFHARYLISNKEFDRALDFLNKRLSADPQWFEGYFVRSEIYLNRCVVRIFDLTSVLNSYINLDSNEDLFKRFKEKVDMITSDLVPLTAGDITNAIKDIKESLDLARSFADQGIIQILRKTFGILVALAYDPTDEIAKTLPLELASSNLEDYIRDLDYADYEASAGLYTIDFWLRRSESISSLYDIRDSLFKENIEYEPTSLLIHYFVMLTSMNQFSMSGRYAFLSTALQAGLDSMRCVYLKNDLYSTFYHQMAVGTFNALINIFIQTTSNSTIEQLRRLSTDESSTDESQEGNKDSNSQNDADNS